MTPLQQYDTVREARAASMHLLLLDEPIPGREDRFPDRDTLSAIRELLDDWTPQEVDEALDDLAAAGAVEIRAGQHGLVWVDAFLPPRLKAVPA